MSTTHSSFIQVLLPLKLKWFPTYSVREPLGLGVRVCVKFSGRIYVGVVWKEDVSPDIDVSRISPIVSVENGLHPISMQEMEFWKFISDYYMCTPGEVYKAAYPNSKTGSEKQSERNLNLLKLRLEKKLLALESAREGTKRRITLLAETDRIRREIESHDKKPWQNCGDRRKSGKPLVLTGDRRVSEYAEAIGRTVSEGMTALVLTPELAFCSQMEKELKAFFPMLMTYNSSMTPVQRRRVSDSVRNGMPAVIIGTRSAVFLPFTRLGLVIIDEEQDCSYKQNEPAPRYNGRDAAIVLASIHGADVILGSCSPSLETYFNCAAGRFRMQNCTQTRARDVSIVDVQAERRKNGMLGGISRKLADEIRRTDGPTVLIRGWENPQELSGNIRSMFPDKDIMIMTLAEFKHSKNINSQLTAVLQADALFPSDNFRTDERALQLVWTLGRFSKKVIIQTAVPDRFDAGRDMSAILRERKQFNFPPYSKIVDIMESGGNGIIARHFLPRDKSLPARKAEIAANLPQGSFPNVDPI